MLCGCAVLETIFKHIKKPSQPGMNQVFCQWSAIVLPFFLFAYTSSAVGFFVVSSNTKDEYHRRCQGTGRTFIHFALETRKSFQYINHRSKYIRQKCLQMVHGNIESLKVFRWVFFFLYSHGRYHWMTILFLV